MSGYPASVMQRAYCVIAERLEAVPESSEYGRGYRRGLENALQALLVVDPHAAGAWEGPPEGLQPNGTWLVY
jgi:hypothetical protein